MVQSSYESAAEEARTMLAEAEKALAEKGPNYKKNMPKSYKEEMAAIKRLKRRVVYREGLIPKRGQTNVTENPKTAVKNKKTSPPKTEKKNQSTGEDIGDWVKDFFGIKDPTKIGGYRTQASKDQAAEKEAKKAAKKAVKKDAQILKDLREAEKQAKAEAKVDKQIAQDSPVTSSTSKRKKETKKAKDAETLKQFKAKGTRQNEDPRDSVTKKMEELLGLNRSASQIEKDLKVTEELESRDRGGMKRGGRAKKPSVSRKTYAMNRGGKVASVRKPTRA